MNRYEQLVKAILSKAKKRGADQTEVFLQMGRDSAVRVRDGEIEDLSQSTQKGLGIRVIAKSRLGFAYTSDFDLQSVEHFIDRAVSLASASASHKLNGLPKKSDLKGKKAAGELFDPAVDKLPADWKIKSALEMEKAGKSVDPRITTFESVGAGDYVSEVIWGSTEGGVDGYQGTYVYLFAMPVASDGIQLQTGYCVDTKRFLSDLQSPEQVGKEAARRALRMLGAKKVKSQKVPVVFDPQMAASFAANVAAAANGDSVFKKASVFAPLMGKTVGSALFSLVDDGVLPRGIATTPFDGEGVPTRRTPIVEKGLLKNFLYDVFTARKAETESTGNAARGYSSLPHIGTHNLYVESGDKKAEQIISEVKRGFYVTALLGSGANPVTGDYSRGANGLWIEDGELAYPVQEVTVAGNLLAMLKNVDAVGSDLQFRGSVAAPTLRFSELAVSGE